MFVLIVLVPLVTFCVFLLVVGACAAHAAASGTPPPLTPQTAVVVLGYPSRRSGRPHPIQRWRSKLAVESAKAYQATRIVFTGGNPTAGRTEAEVMAKLAAELSPSFGSPGSDVVLEDGSISTWQNVAQTMPLVSSARSIVLVSDPLHAARARSYWLRQRPRDHDRVFVTGRSGFFDHWWLKLPTAVHALLRAVFDRFRSATAEPAD